MSPAAPGVGGALPSRSELENWPTQHLDDAATQLRTMGSQSVTLFDEHRQNIAAPGGTTWEGVGKDSALDRVTADSAVVRRQRDVQDEAADIAESGGHDVRAAKREFLDAITAAVNDGFKVGEDLMATDTRRWDINTIAERNKAAAEHADDIRWYAQRLVQTDTFVGERLQEKATELGGIKFEGEGEGDTPSSHVQLVDNEVKHDAAGKDQPGERKPDVPAQAPGQIGPFAVPKSVADAAKKPDEKPPTTGDVGGDLGDLLGANDPATAGSEPNSTAAPVMRPQDIEQFKTQARNLLRQHGVPLDQIEAQVNAMVADAQRSNTTLADAAAHTPANPDTTPGPAPVDTRSLGEKLGDKFNNFVSEAHDQFYNRLDSTVETLQNLTGTGGAGHPGVLESWQQLGEVALEIHMKDPLHLRDPMGPLGPWGAVNGVVDDIPEMIDNPGKHAGDVLFDATAMAATAPLGAEGLLGKSVLPEVGALERGLVSEGGRTLEHGTPPVIPHTTEPPPVAPRTTETPLVPHTAEPPVVPHTPEPSPVPHSAEPPVGHHDAPPPAHSPDSVHDTPSAPHTDPVPPGDGLREVVAESGGKGNWNQELNRPEPNTRYLVDGRFEFVTDAQGRVTHSEMLYDQSHLPGDRNEYQQRIAGGEDRLPNDHGGHTFPAFAGAPGEGINITAMRDTLNAIGQRDYYNMEQEWRRMVAAGHEVRAVVDTSFPGDSRRPEVYTVTTYVDGQHHSERDFFN